MGNSTLPGGLDHGQRVRSQPDFSIDGAQPRDQSGNVERPIVDRRQDQLAPPFEASPADFLFLVLDDDPVNPFLGRRPRPAVSHRSPREILEGEGDVFEDVGGVRSFLEPNEKTRRDVPRCIRARSGWEATP